MDKQGKNKTSNEKNTGYNKAKYEEFIPYAEKIAFSNFFYEDKKIKNTSELIKKVNRVLPHSISRDAEYDYVRFYVTGKMQYAEKNVTYDDFLSIVKKRKLRSILNDYSAGYSYFNITNQENYIVGLFVFEGGKKVVVDTLKEICGNLFFSIHEGSSSLILVFNSVEKEKEFKNYIENDEIPLPHIDDLKAE